MSEILPWEGDITKQLRYYAEDEPHPSVAEAMLAAADLIDRLRAELNAKSKAA
jgi:hypothetical protein